MTASKKEGMYGILSTSVFPLLVPFLFLLFLFVEKYYLYSFTFIFTNFSSILASNIHRRKSSSETDVEEKIKQSIYDNQHVHGNSVNHEEERLTSPMEMSKNITYQGIKTQRPK